MFIVFSTKVYLKLERYDDVINDCDTALKVRVKTSIKRSFIYYYFASLMINVLRLIFIKESLSLIKEEIMRSGMYKLYHNLFISFQARDCFQTSLLKIPDKESIIKSM